MCFLWWGKRVGKSPASLSASTFLFCLCFSLPLLFHDRFRILRRLYRMYIFIFFQNSCDHHHFPFPDPLKNSSWMNLQYLSGSGWSIHFLSAFSYHHSSLECFLLDPFVTLPFLLLLILNLWFIVPQPYLSAHLSQTVLGVHPILWSHSVLKSVSVGRIFWSYQFRSTETWSSLVKKNQISLTLCLDLLHKSFINSLILSSACTLWKS